LSERLGIAPPHPGKPITAEVLKAHRSLLFFACALTDVPPDELTLGDLVRHLRGAGQPRVGRRSADLTPPVRP